MLVLFAVLPDGRDDVPVIVVALMSYPASLLANVFPATFPVRVEGLPELPLPLLLMAVFGFVQWFVAVPWGLAKILASHRKVAVTRADVAGQSAANAALLVGTWMLAEIGALLFSMPLNGMTDAMACHVNAFVFHLWLALPTAVAAGLATLLIARVFQARDSRRWIVALTALFLCASAIKAALLLLGVGPHADHVGPLVEAVIPPLVCVLVGLHMSRRLLPRSVA